MRRLLAIAAVLVGFGMAGCGPGKLTEGECRQLVAKISEVSTSGLTAAERTMIAKAPEEIDADVQACVIEQNWTRAGYDCIMKASTPEDLQACTRENR